MLQSFVECLKEQLLEGKTVNVDGLGCFSLSLRSKGEKTPEEVSAKSVNGVRIWFRANNELKISKNSTRASEKLDLVSLEDYLALKDENEEPIDPDPNETDNPDSGGTGGF